MSIAPRPDPEHGAAGVTRLEAAVSTVLRTGVVISSAVMAAGAAITLVDPSTERAAGRSIPQLRRGALHFSGLRVPHSVASVLQGVAHGYGPAIAMLGLLLLIVTPVLRVAVSVVGFAYERDRTFVLITLTVLVVLIGSFAAGA